MKEITMVVNGNTSYDQVQIEHNERKEGCYGKNVNPEFSHLNIQQVDFSMTEFFDKTFQKAYEDFVKSKQNDTKLSKKQKEMYFDKSQYPDTYLEKLFLERKRYEEEYAAKKAAGVSIKELDKMKQPEIPVKELIIQLGDRDSEFGTLSGDTEAHKKADEILLKFVDDFKKKYPNAVVLGYYIHHDEISSDGKGGTVHMHLDYCWVSKERSRGQSVVCSQNGALKEMGFVAPEKGKHKKGEAFLPITQFQEELRNNLEEISKEFGYERKIIAPEDKKKKQVDVKTYRNSKDAEKESKEIISNAEKEAQTIISDAEQEAQTIISDAEQKRDEIIASANTELETIGEQVVSAQDDLRRTRLEKRRIEGEHEEKVAGLVAKKKQLETDTAAISQKNKDAYDYHTRIKTANEKQDNKYNQNKSILEKLEERCKTVHSRWLDYECNMISAIKDHWLYKKLAKKFKKVEHLYEIEKDRKKMNDVYAYDNRDFEKSGYTPKQILEWQEYFNGLAQGLHEEYKEYYKEMETPSVEDILNAETPDIFTPSQVQDAIDMMNAVERGDDDFEIGG